MMFFRDLTKKSLHSMRKNHIVLLSFFVPVFILLTAYAFHLIYPFGNRSLLLIDLYHQYAPFLAELRNKILSFESLLYTWNGGLGTSFLPLYAYYLASPLNIISVFFPKEHLTELILALVLIKTGLCGAFFAIYLKGVYRENKITMVAFGSMYALCGFMLGYSWNIMWLDCVYLLPLVILGMVKICRGGKGFLYTIALAVLMLSNFYAAFFACVFVALYYPICLLQYNSIKTPMMLLKKTGIFTGWSLLGAGLSTFLLYPTWNALTLTSAIGDRFPTVLTEQHRFFDYLVRHLILATPTVREGMPNMYSGMIVLILVAMYFLSKNISHKVKAMNAVLLIFLISSFNINILDFLWHGMHFPNQLPFRYSYVYIFLVIAIAYPGYRSLKEFSGKQIGAICAALMAAIILYQKLSDPAMNIFMFYISMLFVIIYAGALTVHRRPHITAAAAAMIFLMAVVLEISTNTFFAIEDVDKNESYAGRNGYAAGIQPDHIRDAIDKISTEDRSFFRMEILPPRTTNDPFLYGFKGLSIFASTFQEKTVRSIENFGFHSNSINSYKYEGSTILIDSLFGIKYLLRRSYDIDDRLRTKIYDTGQVWAFENPYSISLGFFMPQEGLGWRSSGSNPFNVQSSLVKNISDIEDIFIPVKIEKGESENLTFESFGSTYIRYKRNNSTSDSVAKIVIQTTEEQQLYLSLDIVANRSKGGYIKIDDKNVDFNPRRSTLVDLGFCSPDNIIEINIEFASSSPESGNFEIRAYSLDIEKFEQAMEIVSQNQLKVLEYSSTFISGHITAPEKGLAVMTMPYDKGWSVKVDGEKVQTLVFDDALLAFEMPQGYHTVTMRFFTDKLPYGLLVSVFSLVVLIYLFALSMMKKKRADL